MKRFTSILCALALVLSVTAAPQFQEMKVAKGEKKVFVEKNLKPALMNAKKHTVELKKFDAEALFATKSIAKAPKAKQDVTFAIEVEDITTKGATITVTPSDEEPTYYWSVIAAEDYAEYSDDEEFIAACLDDIEYTIWYYSNFGDDLTLADFLSQGEDSYEFSTLDGGTDYLVFAFLLDEEGTASGAVATKAFATEEVVLPEGGEFEIVEIVGKFYTADNDYWLRMYDADGNTFRFDIVLPEGVENLESGVTYTLDDMLANYSYATYQGVEIDYAAAEVTKTVEESGAFEINAQFEDEDGNIWKLHYAEEAYEPSDYEIFFELAELDDECATEGWWQILAYMEEMTISVSNLESDQVAGEYAWADLDPSYCFVVFLDNNKKELFVDGSCTLTVDEEGNTTLEGNFTGEFGDTFKLTLIAPAPSACTEYDAEEDFIVDFAEFTVDDRYIAQGYNVVFVQAETENSEYISLELWLPEGADALVAGEYPIEAEEGLAQTVTAGELDLNEGKIYGSFAGTFDEEGYINIPLWVLVDGTVTVDENGVITVDATNCAGAAIKCVLGNAQAIDNVNANATAVKRVVDGVLVIEKNGVRYNVNGAVVR